MVNRIVQVSTALTALPHATQELEKALQAARTAAQLPASSQLSGDKPRQTAQPHAAGPALAAHPDAAALAASAMQQALQAPCSRAEQPAQGAVPLSADQEDAGIRAAIRRYIQDPGFRAYVDRVEALWDEVEQEVLGAEKT